MRGCQNSPYDWFLIKSVCIPICAIVVLVNTVANRNKSRKLRMKAISAERDKLFPYCTVGNIVQRFDVIHNAITLATILNAYRE